MTNNLQKLLADYSISKKLKEIGFDEECFSFYNGDGSFGDIKERTFELGQNKNSFGKDSKCFAPTWDQVVSWFRNEKNINIEVTYLPNVEKYGIVLAKNGFKPKEHNAAVNYVRGSIVTFEYKRFDTYEDARLFVVEKAIELVELENKE